MRLPSRTRIYSLDESFTCFNTQAPPATPHLLKVPVHVNISRLGAKLLEHEPLEDYLKYFQTTGERHNIVCPHHAQALYLQTCLLAKIFVTLKSMMTLWQSFVHMSKVWHNSKMIMSPDNTHSAEVELGDILPFILSSRRVNKCPLITCLLSCFLILGFLKKWFHCLKWPQVLHYTLRRKHIC